MIKFINKRTVMKRASYLALASGISLIAVACSSFAKTENDESQKVMVVESVDTARCQMIKENSCSIQGQSLQSDSDEKDCQNKHLEDAAEAGANAVMFTGTTTSERRRPRVDGRYVTVVSTDVAAEYYACDQAELFAQQEAKQAEEKVEAASQSIEQRLNTLETLKEKELISVEEYQAKRREILNDL
ncbi:MAG: hypothetical protein P1U57_11850 [Oleibacter sp.]|nr:hypothetical protein [Thalassolituus sp.]